MSVRRYLFMFLGCLMCVTWCDFAQARPRLENICRVQGQREQKLIGLGLVIGLRGTGDGGDYLPTTRALMAALRSLNQPLDGGDLLKDSNNVALVMVHATVPATGIYRGQQLNCTVSSIGSAKSLDGGYLMMTPLQSSVIRDKRALALASGSVQLPDPKSERNGQVLSGVTIEVDFKEFAAIFVEDNQFTLLLDAPHASFHSASEVANVINSNISLEAYGRQIAKALAPGVIRVQIPQQYQTEPVEFVATILCTPIDVPHTEPRVVINTKTGTVIVTGEVEISPVLIAHKNLTIAVSGAPPADNGGEPQQGFVAFQEKGQYNSQHLQDLLEALNQLKVPAKDVIDILKELHRSGKLHAKFIIE